MSDKNYFIVGWYSLDGGFEVIGTGWKVAELVEKSKSTGKG